MKISEVSEEHAIEVDIGIKKKIHKETQVNLPRSLIRNNMQQLIKLTSAINKLR